MSGASAAAEVNGLLASSASIARTVMRLSISSLATVAASAPVTVASSRSSTWPAATRSPSRTKISRTMPGSADCTSLTCAAGTSLPGAVATMSSCASSAQASSTATRLTSVHSVAASARAGGVDSISRRETEADADFAGAAGCAGMRRSHRETGPIRSNHAGAAGVAIIDGSPMG